jgi:hypothetical protein
MFAQSEMSGPELAYLFLVYFQDGATLKRHRLVVVRQIDLLVLLRIFF